MTYDAEFEKELERRNPGKIYGVLDETTGKLKDVKYYKGTDLETIHNMYRTYFHIEDTKRIDIVLAVALSSKMDGIPIWLILVGASGDMKSVQLNSLMTNTSVYVMHNLTSKTLVNGYKDKIKHPDLAPELNNKLILIPDMAQILKLPPIEKAELWGQLRDLYDGFAGKDSGQGSRAKYKDLKVTLLAGSTPAIDGQILVHQDLGTRELIYRTEGNVQKHRLMDKCFENEDKEKMISDELKRKTNVFLKERYINRGIVKKDTLEELKKMAIYISLMRATAEIDSYSNELRNYVYPEEPTRIAKQLKRLFICLMSLSDDYPEERAIEILWHIAKSSAFPIRIQMFEYLLKQGEEKTTSKIADDLKIGKKTAQRELQIFWNMGLVKVRREPTNYPGKTYDYWKIERKNSFVQAYSVTKYNT